ncbi:MAG TPA: pyridoxamine 5'-phosphate oxidase family protein [Candidatus Koribacter sp.]|jgi:general stress protein 26
MNIVGKLNELITGIQFAMLTTVHPNDQLHSRPMATQAATDEGFLWFFASQNSSKIDEIRNVNQVNVAYADPANTRYVSVSGTCELVRSRPIAGDLWRDEYKRWFPRGIDDPDLILLKITINSAEYWDATSGRMRVLEGDLTPEEHQTVVLRDERTEVA